LNDEQSPNISSHFVSDECTSCSLPDEFKLNLSDKGIRFGHWNINYLTDSKFVQIKLLLSGFDPKQLDILFITETFLKPTIPDCLFTVPGFRLFRKDRNSKGGGGLLAFVNMDLQVKRRTDLEDGEIEALWLDVCPFKSNRSILFGGVYRPPSTTRETDLALEQNIERANLKCNETIVVGDFNINYLHNATYAKHRLIKGLRFMKLTQLVSTVTRPISGTCLDLLFSNHPERIANVTTSPIGLSDHTPVFATRLYKQHHFDDSKRHNHIHYRCMKSFDKNAFVKSVEQLPWDSAFVFDSIDDILDAWQKLFISVVDEHAPMRSKSVRRQIQPEWMSPEAITHDPSLGFERKP